MSATSQSAAEISGVWGDPTSSVNWCESDYTITQYIAEFFNSLSSCFMVLFGVLGNWGLSYLSSSSMQKDKAKIYDPVLENTYISGINRAQWTWYALQLVGWGSVAFHGSLQWWAQAFDEVPMVWTAILHLTTLLCARYDPLPLSKPIYAQNFQKVSGWKKYLIPGRSSGYVPPISTTFLLHGITCSLLVTLFRGPQQFIVFHILFGSVEISGFYYSYQIFKEVKNNTRNPPRASHSEAAYKSLIQRHRDNVIILYNRGVLTYGLGVLIWSIDLNFCPYISNLPIAYPQITEAGVEWVWTKINPQGHAWWHLLVSIGFYHVNVLATYDKLLMAYNEFGSAVKRGEEGVMELISEEKVNGRVVAGDRDVPVLEWIWGVMPVVRIQRERQC